MNGGTIIIDFYTCASIDCIFNDFVLVHTSTGRDVRLRMNIYYNDLYFNDPNEMYSFLLSYREIIKRIYGKIFFAMTKKIVKFLQYLKISVYILLVASVNKLKLKKNERERKKVFETKSLTLTMHMKRKAIYNVLSS